MKNLTKKLFISTVVCLASVAILSSCAGKPSWLETLPEREPGIDYFVSSGVDADSEKAESMANENVGKTIEKKLFAGLSEYLNLMDFGNNDVLKDFVNAEIQKSAKNNIKNIHTVNSYTEIQEDSSTAVYLLVSCEKTEIEAEQKRILELTKQKALKLVETYIKTAKRLEKEKKYYHSSLNYTYAAASAIKTNFDDVKLFDEQLVNAERALRAFKFGLLDSNNKKYKKVESSFDEVSEKEGFASHVFYISAFEEKVPFDISYTIKKENADLETIQHNILSNDAGFARFIMLIPEVVCCGRADFRLDMTLFEKAMDGINSDELENKKSTLLNNAFQKAISREYRITR